MTYGDIYARIRDVFPGADDKMCNALLWTCTPFPCDCDPDRLVECLRRYSTDDPQVAMAKAELEMREAMKGWRDDV